MNAMAWEVATGLLEDPFGGRSDIRARLVRSVGDAAARFSEDGLRPLRAVRFAAQLEFDIDPATFEAIGAALGTFRQVSAERMRDEFTKLLMSGQPARGLSLLEKSGLLGEMIPEIMPARGCSQKGMHAFDVMDHLFLAVEASKPDLALRLAALFHDIGKPAAKEDHPDGIPSFHNHERISSDMARAAMRRLKLPNDIIEKVLHLVLQHMFNYTPDWSDAAVRRFLARVGPESVEDLFDLRIADAAATAGTRPDPRPLDAFRNRIDAVLTSRDALGLKDLAIGGNDLAELGIPRGPVMGRILQALLETVLDDPLQNERDILLRIASNIKEKFGVV
jgi:poly(A) polymerase/tRNA nucleotidyltransferase (CCA-adding enzyme)